MHRPFLPPTSYQDLGCGQDIWSTINSAIYFMLVILWAPPLAEGNEQPGASRSAVSFGWTPWICLHPKASGPPFPRAFFTERKPTLSSGKTIHLFVSFQNIYSSGISFQNPSSGTSLAVQWLGLRVSTAGGAWVQPLVGELRSCMPCGAARKKKRMAQNPSSSFKMMI